jgi:hypothetical protein
MPPRSPPSGPKSNAIISGLNNIQVVLNDQNAVPRIHQAVLKPPGACGLFGDMQTGGGLIQNIEGLAIGAAA